MVSEVSAIEVASTTLRRPGRRRRNRAILNVGVERTVKRHHIDIRIRYSLTQESFGTPDLGGARKKDQQRS